MVAQYTCSKSTVGHSHGKVDQEQEMCLGEEMGNCPAPYSQAVIAALSAIPGSLMEIKKLSMMQNCVCGKD